MKFLQIALAAGVLIPAGFADAHEHLKSPGQSSIATQRQVCAADFARFCPGQAMGGGRMGRCLISYVANLTPDCADTVHHWCPSGRCP